MFNKNIVISTLCPYRALSTVIEESMIVILVRIELQSFQLIVYISLYYSWFITFNSNKKISGTKELKELHNLYEKSVNLKRKSYLIIYDSLESKNKDKLSEGITILDEARAFGEDHFNQLQMLMDEYDQMEE